MGRSPLFEYFVNAIESKDMVPGFEHIKVKDYIRIIPLSKEKEASIPQIYGISRSCSTYGREEIFFPTADKIFIVENKNKYIFWKVYDYDPWNPFLDDTLEKIFLTKIIGNRLSEDIHSNIKSFLSAEYRCISLDIVNNDDKVVTFVIRSDGTILNIEDFSIRGYIQHIEKIH